MSTHIGYGYFVPNKKIEQLEKRGIELADNFLDNKYITPINSWLKDTDYFFGIIYGVIDEGEVYKIPAVHDSLIAHDDLMNMIQEYKTYFTNEDNYICHNYVLCCVD